MSDNIIPLNSPKIQGLADSLKAKLQLEQAAAGTPRDTGPAIIEANADGTIRPPRQQQLVMHPFADGSYLGWMQNPQQPTDIVLVVNTSPEPTQPKPYAIGLTRLPDIAHLLCQAVNFMFAAQAELTKQN